MAVVVGFPFPVELEADVCIEEVSPPLVCELETTDVMNVEIMVDEDDPVFEVELG